MLLAACSDVGKGDPVADPPAGNPRSTPSATNAGRASMPSQTALPSGTPTASGTANGKSSGKPSKITAGPTNYAGKVEFDSYDGNKDKYKSGTEKQKASNVPLPKAPDGMNEKTRDGLYKFIGYVTALWNYTELTGDTGPILKVVADADFTKEFFSFTKELYSSKTGWLISETFTPIEISLEDEKPYEGPTPDSYVWFCKFNVDGEAKYYNSEDPQQSQTLQQTLNPSNNMYVKYVNKEWKYFTKSIDGFKSTKKANI